MSPIPQATQGMNPMQMGQPQQPGPMPPQAPPMPVPEDINAEETIEEIRTDQPAEEALEAEQAFNKSVQYDISEEEKRSIVTYIKSSVDNCESGRSAMMEIRTECLDLLNQVRAPKNIPWPNCSNISTGAVPTHCKIMHAKLFPAVWNENNIHWKPAEKNDVQNTENVSKLMKWVTRQELDMQNLIDDFLWDFVTNGTVALKTRWETVYRTVADIVDGKLKYRDIAHEKAAVDSVSIDDVYLPSLWEGVDKSEFIGQNIYNKLMDIEDLIDRNIFVGDDLKERLIPKIDERVGESLSTKKKKIEGTAGVDPVVVAGRNSLPIRLIEFYCKWRINGTMKESVFTIGYESGAYLSGKPLSAVSRIGKRPWTIKQFMKRTGSPYGIGLPELMRGLAKELDAIHNQRIDAGSVSIAPFGFYRAGSALQPSKIQIGPAVMIPVDNIKDVNIINLQFNPIASFQEEVIIVQAIEKLTTTSAYQMGRESDVVKSRATATGTMAIINQGEQAYTVLGMRAQDMVADLLTKVLQTYQMWMPTGFAKDILGAESEAVFKEGLSPEAIAGCYDCYMTLDTTSGNMGMERQGNAAMVEMYPTLMTLAQEPRGYRIAADFVKSIGKVDVEAYLGKPPSENQMGQAPVPMGAGMGQLPQGGQPGGPQPGMIG